MVESKLGQLVTVGEFKGLQLARRSASSCKHLDQANLTKRLRTSPSRRLPWSGALFLLFVALVGCTLGLPASAQADPSPEDVGFCGAFNQRACCLGEAFPSCEGSLAETGAIGGSCSVTGLPAGLCGYSSADRLSDCGGDAQRACCLGEVPPLGPCDSGNVELIDVFGGTCPSPALAVGANAGSCWTPTPCGGEGQRACTLVEQIPSCDPGLIEIGGCDDFSCGNSSGWCYRPTPCGGEGQRACCTLFDIGGNTTTCNDGLRVVPGASGDATCGIGNLVGSTTASTETCASLSLLTAPIAEPETGWSPDDTDGSRCDARGYADLHAHMFANLGHGGGAMSGVPYSEDGVNDALRQDFGTYLDLVKKDGTRLDEVKDLAFQPCDPALYPDCGKDGFRLFHGDHLFDHVLGAGTYEGRPSCLTHLALGCGAGSNLGSPLFTGWPTWRTTTHQQMYYKWLERAWRGGLRLMTQLAVTNEALCRSSKVLRGTDCNDEMGPVDAQIDATWEFQALIDEMAGGPGLGWFRVVTTPGEARRVIDEGKLAVVIGIEVANLFDCKKAGCSGKEAGESDVEYIERKVDEYYHKGVRVVFPIHNFENAFGAPATWQDAIHAGNYVSEGEWWVAEDCSSQNYGFQLDDFKPFIVQLFGFGNLVFPPSYDFVSCNQNGLTPLGDHMIRYMMQKGIVVDVDHMSNHAFDATLDIAEELHRPVVASHVQFFDLNKQSKRHERMRTRAQLDRIRDSGGMIAAMLKDDQQDSENVVGKFNLAYTDSPSGTVIADDCRYSSKTWAQGYQYASDVMAGPVAMGSDWNGVAGHVGPRFGNDACGQDANERSRQARAGNKLEYPFSLPGLGAFERQVTGAKSFDFNVDGLAHVGLLPDMVADLGQIGLSDADLEPLMNSASGFVDVWDRAEGREPGIVPGCTACSAASDCDDGNLCTVDSCVEGVCELESNPDCLPLDVWRVRSRRNRRHETRSLRMHAGLADGNVFTGAAPITVQLTDGEGATDSFTFTDCSGTPTRTRCSDGERVFRFRTSPLRRSAGGVHVSALLRNRDLGKWPVAPVTVSLHYDGVLSSGTVERCRNASIGVSCR